MNYNDITRWEAEIQSWRERYETLLKTMADNAALAPAPRLLVDKESYELGRSQQSEREGWRYADELEQERMRLREMNKELLKVLQDARYRLGQHRVWDGFEYKFAPLHPHFAGLIYDQLEAAIAKAEGEQHE